jgi:dTMP kinase
MHGRARAKEVAVVFITFEGLDGAGKSTQISRLVSRMERAGEPVVVTREPGGTDGGNLIREWLLREDADWTSIAEAYLYAASRAQLVETVILKELTEGRHVVCDRYVDASVAYQGAGLGIGEERVREMNDLAIQGVMPDLTFLFDLPVETSKARTTAGRGRGPADRIEQRSIAFFERVRMAFLRLAKDHPERVVVLDATRSAGELEQDIWETVANSLNLGKGARFS